MFKKEAQHEFSESKTKLKSKSFSAIGPFVDIDKLPYKSVMGFG